jgi:hypothetical protein
MLASSPSSRLVRFLGLNTLAAILVVANFGCGVASTKDDDGPTSCPSDAYEPNDTNETATDLGDMQDDPDSAKSITSSVHVGTDTDWFKAHIADEGLGGDPVVTVAVSSGFTVSTWFVCDGRRTSESSCLHGSSDYERVGDVEGCRGERVEPELDANGAPIGEPSDDNVATTTTDCSGTSSDNGTLYIRVDRSASTRTTCSYELTINVE